MKDGNEDDSFTNTTEISQVLVLKGNLSSPAPSGNLETFTLELAEIDSDVLAFTVEVYDDAGHVSKRSNIALVYLKQVKEIQTVFETTTDQLTTEYTDFNDDTVSTITPDEEVKQENLATSLEMWAIIAVVVFVCIIVGIIYIAKARKAKTYDLKL